MSDQERSNVATRTCSILSETNALDSVLRVREVNVAREKIEEPPYVEGDSGIIESLTWDVCEELVLNDPLYKTKLQTEKKLVAKKVAEQERLAEIERQTRETLLQQAREQVEDEVDRFFEEKISQIGEKYSLSCPESESEWEVFAKQITEVEIFDDDEENPDFLVIGMFADRCDQQLKN